MHLYLHLWGACNSCLYCSSWLWPIGQIKIVTGTPYSSVPDMEIVAGKPLIPVGEGCDKLWATKFPNYLWVAHLEGFFRLVPGEQNKSGDRRRKLGMVSVRCWWRVPLLHSLGPGRGMQRAGGWGGTTPVPLPAAFGDPHPWQAGKTEELAQNQIRWKPCLNGCNDVWK